MKNFYLCKVITFISQQNPLIMRKYLLLLALNTMGLALVAQQPPISHLDINNVNATFLGDGSCFTPQQYDQWNGEIKPCPTWEVPAGSGKETIYQHTLWFGGVDSEDTLHVAGMRFGQDGQDYRMGPLQTMNPTVDWMTSMKYHHIWNLTRAEIEQFIANHNNAGYQIPEDILTWPAHGEDGYATDLAPFVDVNNDGHYNPADGDYPDIQGDQCLFFIFNDYRSHTETNGIPVGLEAHCMVYGFDAPDDEALNNTVFIHYTFFNRSDISYHNTYLGLFTDWDLGDQYNDYVGCDVQRNSCYAYNGYQYDGSGEPWAYDSIIPAQVLTVLNGPDGLGMTGFMYFNNTGDVMGDPRNAAEYYSYMQSCWRDGNHLQYGGNGYPGQWGTVGPECNYMFPGDSDPDNIGTGGVAPNEGYNTNGKYWTESEAGNQPGDRRGLASVGPFNFPAGGKKELDYAMITVWGDGYGPMASVSNIGTFVDHIKALFENGFAK